MSNSMKDLVADAKTRVATIRPGDAQAARQGGDVILEGADVV